MYDNTINLVGNLTADPDFKVTTGGVAVAKLRLACSRRVFDRTTNEWRDGEPAFFSVTAWRQLAQNIHTSLRKGDRAIVVGRMRQSSYEQNNEKRTRWEVEADAVGAELSWSYAQVQRARRTVTETQETSGAADGLATADGPHAEADSATGLDADLSFLTHEQIPDEPAEEDVPEPAAV